MINTIYTRIFLLCISCLTFTSNAATNNNSEWISLFDGKTFSGWQANERPESWKIEDGAIVTNGERSHLFYVGKVADHNFKNFVFSASVKSSDNANSGIYIHTKFAADPWPVTGYEAQVYNSKPTNKEGYIERKMTGSIYAVRNVWLAPVKNNEWFEYQIKVSGKTIQTFINGALVCEYTENDSPWRSQDKLQRLLSSGTFAFQAHDPDSIVHFRDIKVRVLPDNAPSLSTPTQDKKLDQLISQFSNDNVALIDLGVVTGTAQGSALLTKAQKKTAMQYGLALNNAFSEQALNLANTPNDAAVIIINDKNQPPSVALIKAAKANGAKIAFSSGGDTQVSAARLKLRLMAMKKAGISWQDIWVPGT